MNLRFKVLSVFMSVCIVSLLSCSSDKEQASSELIQTAKHLVEQGDFNSANSILNTVEKMSPKMNEVLELRKTIEQKEMEKVAVRENPLYLSFVEDGIRVEVNGVAKTRKPPVPLSGWQLSEGETWIILNTVLKEQANKNHQTNWRGYFRLISKSGDALSPSIGLTSPTDTPDYVHGNERKEMKILFRAKESDAPWKLRFANGGEKELVF